MSALDLVEEFRSLDEVEDTDKVEDSAIGKLSGVHNSIGEAATAHSRRSLRVYAENSFM